MNTILINDPNSKGGEVQNKSFLDLKDKTITTEFNQSKISTYD